MDVKDKIFVAGGKGMVGNAIIRRLLSEGYSDILSSYFNREPNVLNVKWERLDLRRQSDVDEFFDRYRPDYVFLAAAKVGGILANDTYKAEFIYDNLMIAANVINSAYRFGVKKLLNLGSSCIYPKHCPQPMKEEYLLTGELEPTNEPYAIAKIAAIKLCRYYNEQYGADFVSVMPTNLYGPGDNFHLLNSHVLPALIRKFYLAKLLSEGKIEEVVKDVGHWEKIQGKNDVLKFLSEQGITEGRVRIWGTGNVRREFLYVDDLADIVVWLMKNYSYSEIGEFVNVGVGEDITIRELAFKIKDMVGFKGEVYFDASMPDGTPRKLLDVSGLKALGKTAKISLEDGIKRVLEIEFQSYD